MARIDVDVDSSDSTNITTVESHGNPGSNYLRSVLIELPVLIYLIIKQKLLDRAACRHLLQLDNDHLKDIGVTREDVIWARRRKNATLDLQSLVTARRHTSHTVVTGCETEPTGHDAGAKSSVEVIRFLTDLDDSTRSSLVSTNRPPAIEKTTSEK